MHKINNNKDIVNLFNYLLQFNNIIKRLSLTLLQQLMSKTYTYKLTKINKLTTISMY